MNQYKYTQSWFLDSELKKKMSVFCENKTNTILEIGCFEGLSTVFFADNFLNFPNSTLTCVDPFLSIDNNDHRYLLDIAESNFNFNIANCKNSNKITFHKITSDTFFENNKQTFTFIYIDGCHLPEFITKDMENSFNVLEKNGIMWMDDYGGGMDNTIKNTMNNFLEKYKGLYEFIHVGYQLGIIKS
jgi:predicted O-methyltransferase YrrM